MASILLSWLVIGFYAYLYGRTGIRILYKEKEKALQSADIYIVCGLMILNLYAQFFSLFYKVGAMAFGILSLGAAACVLYLRLKDKKTGYGIAEFSGENKCGFSIRIILCLAAFFGTLLWTNVVPQHYDTYLYHAQAIRWIEEYGVVPGLGNLHFRLAYNSAFMTLQSLFSFVWLTGRSMHTVNGFVAAFMLCFVAWTFYREKEHVLQISDVLKLGVIAYLIYASFHVSSPNTDTWSLLLLSYICIKWSEFGEKQVENASPYAFLCLLSVYAMTLKLSTAVFVILTVYPAVLLLYRKQWKQIWQHIAAGIMTAAPYFIRNIIISGYLIYPYPEIDLFRLDWKMSERTLMADRKEIIAWGRGNMDISRCDEPITRWFFEWFMSIHLLWRVLFVIAVFAGILLLIKAVKDLKERKKIRENTLAVTCIMGLLFWLFSAPLPRYGVVYMLFLSCIGMGAFLEILQKGSHEKSRKYNILLGKAGSIALGIGIIFYSMFYFTYSYINNWGGQTILWQTDYEDKETKPVELDGHTVSTAVQTDQTGYDPFPTTPYMGTAESIELRGDDWKSGFRER